jgi:hypothetical protein
MSDAGFEIDVRTLIALRGLGDDLFRGYQAVELPEPVRQWLASADEAALQTLLVETVYRLRMTRSP